MREVTTTISSRDFFGPLSKARRRFRYLKARIGIGGEGKRIQRILVGGALLKGVNDTKRQDSSIHHSMGNRKIVIPTITVCVLTYVHIGDDSAKTRGLAVFSLPPLSSNFPVSHQLRGGGGELNPPEALFSFYLSGNDPDDFSPSLHPSPALTDLPQGPRKSGMHRRLIVERERLRREMTHGCFPFFVR